MNKIWRAARSRIRRIRLVPLYSTWIIAMWRRAPLALKSQQSRMIDPRAPSDCFHYMRSLQRFAAKCIVNPNPSFRTHGLDPLETRCRKLPSRLHPNPRGTISPCPYHVASLSHHFPIFFTSVHHLISSMTGQIPHSPMLAPTDDGDTLTAPARVWRVPKLSQSICRYSTPGTLNRMARTSKGAFGRAIDVLYNEVEPFQLLCGLMTGDKVSS